MARKPRDIPRKLIHVIGYAIEAEAKKYEITHIEILIALERLREAMTEDFVSRHPKDVWMLQGLK